MNVRLRVQHIPRVCIRLYATFYEHAHKLILLILILNIFICLHVTIECVFSIKIQLFAENSKSKAIDFERKFPFSLVPHDQYIIDMH